MTKTSALALLLLASCVVGEVEEADDPSASLQGAGGNLYSRVVLGRLYQTERWMLPQADTYKAAEIASVTDRRIAYVCDALVRLDPTYVSGLVRLSWDTVVTEEMKTIFAGVKRCVRAAANHPVRFDVVLNAKHYAEPRSTSPKDGVSSREEGRDRLRERLRTARNLLEPEIWFFDFYTVPFNDGTQQWFDGAMRDGIDMIHEKKELVGGNVWGKTVPPGTDFAALPLTGGFEGTMDQIQALETKVPTFVHIRNDPHICGSEGIQWFEWTPERRSNAIEGHAGRQQGLNVGYMYPLFFPLSPIGDCAAPGTTQVAYDAMQDGVLGKMRNLMDRYEYRPRP